MTAVASALKTHPMPSSSSLRSLIVCRDPGPRVTEVGWELRGRFGMSMSPIFPPTPTFWGIHLASKKGIPVFFNAVAFNPRAGCGWCRLPPFVSHNSHLDWGVLECGWIVISTFHDHGIDEVPGDMKEQLATVDAATVSAHQELTFLCPHRRPNCGEVFDSRSPHIQLHLARLSEPRHRGTQHLLSETALPSHQAPSYPSIAVDRSPQACLTFRTTSRILKKMRRQTMPKALPNRRQGLRTPQTLTDRTAFSGQSRRTIYRLWTSCSMVDFRHPRSSGPVATTSRPSCDPVWTTSSPWESLVALAHFPSATTSPRSI